MPDRHYDLKDVSPPLAAIKQRLLGNRILFALVIGITLVITGILTNIDFLVLVLGTVLVCVIILASLFIEPTYRRIKPKEFLLYLNRIDPQFEESAQLLLRPRDPLPLLQRLQWDKMNSHYEAVLQSPSLWLPAVPFRAIFRLIMMMAALLATGATIATIISSQETADPVSEPSQGIPSPQPAGITSIEADITPPIYTGLPPRTVTSGNMEIPEGSSVTWKFQFSRSDGEYLLKSGDHAAQRLARNTSGSYELTQDVQNSALYQIIHKTGTTEYLVGDIYTVAVRKDQKPSIRLVSPKASTIEFTRNADPIFMTLAEIVDDYGISDTRILASVAKGSGEAVKFRDEIFEFDSGPGEGKNVYQRDWDLKKLGMEPGDELYFSIIAEDNKMPVKNLSKSATVIVRWLDEAANTITAEGIVSDFIPEYFKSQRQIIIETEQLIADQPALNKKIFSETSYSLGQAQSDLKQRYGQYLGDEFGEGPGEQLAESSAEASHQEHTAHEGDEHEKERPEVGHLHDKTQTNATGDAASQLIARFGHSHEDADIGPIAKRDPKTLMKKAVSIMWQAELHLMLAEPAKALPFEYEALKFLKLAKQADRIYVKRLGFEPPPVSEEKRLTGELKEISGYSSIVEQGWNKPEEQALVRAAFRIFNASSTLDSDNRAVLSDLSKLLQKQAQQRPAVLSYAATLEKVLLSNSLVLPDCEDCVSGLKSALWKMLSPAESIPQLRPGYFSPTDPLIQLKSDDEFTS
ncbi:DUF4175 domain-containing protein [Kordiimonas aestuarii]|uniref:DUF4175 domain-containing protein n=1 Tax=Kordiimonas aestuarii TaxID=1005925 RepID=UPI0021D099B8|nr:DUF4175 domain-containing protein [Kordiimonas aestuarii]